MSLESDATIMATRVLSISNGEAKELVVVLYQPYEIDKDEWVCVFKLGEQKKKAHGIDSFQALIMAIEGIRYLLDNTSINLNWCEGSNFLGFPKFVPMFLPDNYISDIESILEKKVKDITPTE